MRAMRTILVLALLLVPTASAIAQPGHDHMHGHGPAPAAPAPGSAYREQLATGARGLSAQEVDDLLTGRGIGLARAAELNGYPGPRHVLDAARDKQLVLTEDQTAAVQRIFEGMEQDAQKLGANVVAEEKALEAAFRAGTITEADLTARVKRLATIQGYLREVHLRAHLATRAVLSEVQIARYNEIRGYAGASAPGATGTHRH